LTILGILEPIVEDVARWLEGDDKEMPVSLRALPDELKSEVELRLLKARVEAKEP